MSPGSDRLSASKRPRRYSVYASVVLVDGRTSVLGRDGGAARGSDPTMAWVSSSWSANTSASVRSYESDQS